MRWSIVGENCLANLNRPCAHRPSFCCRGAIYRQLPSTREFIAEFGTEIDVLVITARAFAELGLAGVPATLFLQPGESTFRYWSGVQPSSQMIRLIYPGIEQEVTKAK